MVFTFQFDIGAAVLAVDDGVADADVVGFGDLPIREARIDLTDRARVRAAYDRFEPQRVPRSEPDGGQPVGLTGGEDGPADGWRREWRG